jgi:uncharacterized protein YjbJ (UPF0337 family)
MNSNRVNGKIDDVVGSAKRKVGNLTGNTPLQVKGAVQQVKGKLQNAAGKVQDAVGEVNLQANPPRNKRS